ncbi:hypothetical protein FACS189427_12960 [Planctomycetales bacterium]|nr:hypothetical protein FACS189427_12960 [Planctomycetales bacterium]
MIPLASLAGILITVALNMSEYRIFVKMVKRAPKSDTAVMLLTFFLTVFLDLTIAIPVGLILASFMFMRRMEHEFGTSSADNSLYALSDDDPHEDPIMLRVFEVPDGVHVYNIKGPFFFGAAGKFLSAIQGEACRVIILRMLHVPVLDATGVNAIEELLRRTEKDHTVILMSGIRQQPKNVLEKYGLLEKIGKENIHETIVEALLHAAEIVQEQLAAKKRSQTNRLAGGL